MDIRRQLATAAVQPEEEACKRILDALLSNVVVDARTVRERIAMASSLYEDWLHVAIREVPDAPQRPMITARLRRLNDNLSRTFEPTSAILDALRVDDQDEFERLLQLPAVLEAQRRIDERDRFQQLLKEAGEAGHRGEWQDESPWV